jgi:tetraacyldisaccharide 4'-kinase
MTLLRKILFRLPFYGMITGIRNYLFDRGILKSYTFNVPIIAVGILMLVALENTPN